MKGSYAAASLALFVLSVGLLVLLTLFESSLINMSMTAERLISAVFLVLPGIAGVVLGIMSIRRNEANRWMALLGIALNSLFALFQILVLSFAG